MVLWIRFPPWHCRRINPMLGPKDCIGGGERFAAFEVFKLPPPPLEKIYSFYPFLWTREANERSPDARLIDADEAVRLRLEMAGFEVN